MKDKVLEWLKKTGYPLELYGEAILSDLGFSIINSHLYLDSEKYISRELDLLANFREEKDGIVLSVNVLIECKKSDKPLILLATNEKKEELSVNFGEFLHLNDPHMRTIAGNSPKIMMPGKSSYGFKVIQAFTDGDELINKAANTLLKSLKYFNSESQKYLEFCIKENEHRVVLPVLLIDAPLVELKLNENKDMEINEIDSCILEYKNPLPSSMEEPFLIPIIKKEFLKEFCSNLISITDNIIINLKEKPLHQIKNYHETELSLVKRN